MTEPVQPSAVARNRGDVPPRRTRRSDSTPSPEAYAEVLRRMVRDDSKVRLNLHGTRPIRIIVGGPSEGDMAGEPRLRRTHVVAEVIPTARAAALRRMLRDDSKVRLNLNGTRPLRTTVIRPGSH